MEEDLHKGHYFINQYKYTLLFADDQDIIADLKDNLHYKTYKKIWEWKYHQKQNK
jgi:hypothetical protein